MKKTLFPRLVLCIIVTALIPLYSFSQITSEKADSIFKTYVSKSAIDVSAWLYSYSPSIDKKFKVVNIINEEVAGPDFSSWLYFIDEKPFYNWAHDCRFVFISVKNGEIYTVKALNPPKHLENWRMLTKMPKVPDAQLYNINTSKVSPQSSQLLPMAVTPEHRYAIIISGGADMANNWVRFWNDCSSMFKTLFNTYGFPQNHIYTLVSDGTNPANDRHLNNGTYDSSPLDLNADGVNDIQYSATAANISSVFDQLSGVLTCQDYLFIYTTDHGGTDGGTNVKIYLWNGETMTDAAFATQVNKVHPGYINIVMEQCYSGGFIDNLAATNRVIATACTAYQSSHSTADLNYDEFVYHWTAAVYGSYPGGGTVNADANGDGLISMSEAFSYANAHDAYLSTETPQYYSNYSILGQNLTMRGNDYCTTRISGPFLVCNSGSSYSLTNLSPGETVTWSSSSNISYSSGQYTNNYTVVPIGVAGYGYIAASVSTGAGCGSFTLPQDNNVWSGKFESTYVTGTAAVCPGSLYTYTALVPGGHVPGYSYSWTYPSGWMNNGQNQNSILLQTPMYNMTYGTVRVSVTNCNGASGYSGITVYPRSGCPGYFSVFPNPASDNITINIIENPIANAGIDTSGVILNTLSSDVTNQFTVSIYNKQGILLVRLKRSGKCFDVPLTNFRDGNYIIEINDGTSNYSQQLIVKHN